MMKDLSSADPAQAIGLMPAKQVHNVAGHLYGNKAYAKH